MLAHKKAPIAALPRRVPRPWNCHPSALEVILCRPQEPPPPKPLSPRVRRVHRPARPLTLHRPHTVDSNGSQRPALAPARTGDSPGSLRNRYLKKTLKYASIVEGLRKAFTPCKVEQITLVVGLLGSIEESRWRQSLEAFGMTGSQKDNLIRRCMVATIEGTHLVLGVGDT